MKTIILITLLMSMTLLRAEKVIWPNLDNVKSISGKAATEQDIKNGQAVFILAVEGKTIGKPLKLKIPQYAIYTDKETGEKINVIIIQGEEANGQKYIGAINIKDNSHLAAMFHEFTLLGVDKPKSNKD